MSEGVFACSCQCWALGCDTRFPSLQVFLSAFYYNNASSTNRGDYNMYMVLAYVAIFRLEEMGVPRFRYLLNGLDTLKMHRLLSFLFDIDSINTWCKEEWCKSLDRKYVEVRSGTRAHQLNPCRLWPPTGYDPVRDCAQWSRGEAVVG